METTTLFSVKGEPVKWDGEKVSFLGEFTINGDGSPRCYGPAGTKALDFLGNAGRPGNWWGVATHNDETWGEPIIQGPNDPYPGLYVSTTAYKVPGFSNRDPRRYLDSEKVRFLVAPRRLIRAVRGIVIGSRGRVTDKRTGISVDAVVGDIGPDNHLGEGSMKLAADLGLPSSPRRGGSRAKVFEWEIWPGVAAPGFVLQGRFSKARLAVLDAVAAAEYVA